MLWKNSSSDQKDKDERTAKVLWWILMAMRLVIPLYVLYAIYLYWTLPPSNYLLTGH